MSNVIIALVEFVTGRIRPAVGEGTSLKAFHQTLQCALMIPRRMAVDGFDGHAHPLVLRQLQRVKRSQYPVRINGLNDFRHARSIAEPRRNRQDP